MRLLLVLLPLICFAAPPRFSPPAAGPYKRLVILKVDGLSGDLLYNTIDRTDSQSGKSELPWFDHVFVDQGIVFENFYTRGISLSAPSWSILDTGRHAIIRGNAEFDRYTGQVYDYLNAFPFYIGYARKTDVDMPGVEVLERAGIPLVVDRFDYQNVLQGFQLFQRGVNWRTLQHALLRNFSGRALSSVYESTGEVSLSSSLYKQLETELVAGLSGTQLLYLDFYTGDADHEGHASNDPAALLHVMKQVDQLVGRVWTAIQNSPFADQTLLVVVSDHGMNNVPGIISQTFSLPDVFNSVAGGGQHVVTNREQLSDFKLKGINPLIHRVITPSAHSLYLKGESSRYPTAWLDIDGNERAAVHLRNNDLNKLQILLQQMARPDLDPALRTAAAGYVSNLLDRHRAEWTKTADELKEELAALQSSIDVRRRLLATLPKKFNSDEQSQGKDKAYRRIRREWAEWQDEEESYGAYLAHLQKLLRFVPDGSKPCTIDIASLIPPMALGEQNTFTDVQHYVVGPSERGLVLAGDRQLDEERSFSYVDYFEVLSRQRARNNPQSELSSHPIDFTAMRLPDAQAEKFPSDRQHVYLLYGDDEHQLLISQRRDGDLMLQPVRMRTPSHPDAPLWHAAEWTEGLPLRLWEDPHLQIPSGADRAGWLSSWHSEREWLSAIHKCKYSNGAIGITEELSPIGPDVPGPPDIGPVLLRYERRRRQLVQADFHVFASDHWNFNVRFPNPGGNHGGFFRISTQSVWMMAGAGLPAQRIETPYDSLNFANTLLHLLGRVPPMTDRVVQLP